MPVNKPEKSARAREIEALILEAATPKEASAAMNYALDSLLEEPQPITDTEAHGIRSLVNRKIRELLAEGDKKPS
jgi:hypothetical protein